MSFPVPTCTCGHPIGDHVSNRSRQNPKHGLCLANGCDCTRFVDAAAPSDKQQSGDPR